MKIESHINGSVKIYIIPETDLDREILKRMGEESKIEVAGSASVHFGKALHEGSLIITENEKTIQ